MLDNTFIFILFSFVSQTFEGAVNVLYIEKSINLLISMCFLVFSLETNRQMRNVLNLTSGVITDMDIISFNKFIKQTGHFFNVHFYAPKMQQLAS